MWSKNGWGRARRRHGRVEDIASLSVWRENKSVRAKHAKLARPDGLLWPLSDLTPIDRILVDADAVAIAAFLAGPFIRPLSTRHQRTWSTSSVRTPNQKRVKM